MDELGSIFDSLVKGEKKEEEKPEKEAKEKPEIPKEEIEARQEELGGLVTTEGAEAIIKGQTGKETGLPQPRIDVDEKGEPVVVEEPKEKSGFTALIESSQATEGEQLEAEVAKVYEGAATTQEKPVTDATQFLSGKPYDEPDTGFDYSPVKTAFIKVVMMIYGIKGHGKTFFALGVPGTIGAISLDKKTDPIKRKDFSNDPRITVYDGTRYMASYPKSEYLRTSDMTFRYIMGILNEMRKDPPDWVMIDGTEDLNLICEMVMRYRNNLEPFQGISNRNIWKERVLYIQQIHDMCVDIAKRGVIYTAYTSREEIIKDGNFVLLDKVPKWIGHIMTETDVVIRVSMEFEGGKKKYTAVVESSKMLFPNAVIMNVTDKGMDAFKVFEEK